MIISNHRLWNSYSRIINVLTSSTEYNKMLTKLNRSLGLRKSDKVLDLGCGQGTWMRRYGWVVESVLGIDFAESMLNKAKTELVLNNNISLLRADLSKEFLPLADGSFNKAVSVLLFGYLDKEGQVIFLSEVNRVLEPGGSFGFITPKKNAKFLEVLKREYAVRRGQRNDLEIITKAFPGILAALYGIITQLKSKSGAFNFTTQGELVELLKAAGFRINSIKPVYADQAYLVIAVKPNQMGYNCLG